MHELDTLFENNPQPITKTVSTFNNIPTKPDFDGPDYRNIGDVDELRKAIFDQALEAANSIPPVSNNRYTLSVSDARYMGPERLTRAKHKEALMNGTNLNRKLSATWTLTDNATGKPVAQRRTILARIPYMTDLGTFVRSGNDYTVSHQFRLKPGVYTRIQDNGELEAHVNVSGGLGSKVFLDPATGVFRMKFGQANLPVIDVLTILGADPKAMRYAWNDDLFAMNAQRSDPKALNKLYDKMTYGKGTADNEEDKIKEIRKVFNKMGLDPDVSRVTLGAPYDKVNVESLLATTKKLLDVNKGLQDVDSRDNIAFQRLFGPNDIIADRIKNCGDTMRKLLWKMSAKNNLDKLPAGALDQAVEGAIIGSGLGQPVEEVNPLELFDNQYQVSRLGEGGIGSIDSIPDSARNVQPSQFGFVDLLRTPESMKAGVVSRIASSVKVDKNGRMYTKVRDRKGDIQWKSAGDLEGEVTALPNELKSDKEFVSAYSHGRIIMAPRDEVTGEFPRMQNAQYTIAQMVPMASAIKGQRALMASRMLVQALPLENREAPLVQSGDPDSEDESYEEKYGVKAGAIRAKEPCQVVKVLKDHLVVRNQKGEEENIELYKDLAFNRKTGLNQEAVVKPGDILNKGDLIATSNFTDKNGHTAVGTNARVAFLPFRGLTWEDGIVVSQSFADRTRSTHYYKNKLAVDKDTRTGKNFFLSAKPGVYTKDQVENFTDDGVIKPGTTVNMGDPLILAVSKVEPTEAQAKAGRKFSWRDQSVTWEHEDPGIVTDVINTPKGIQVIVKNSQPLKIADKLSGRQGNKGVIADIVPDEELPTLPDGTKPEVLMSPLGIVSRVNPAAVIEMVLGKIAKKTGKRYAIKDWDNIEDLTQFAMDEAKKYGIKDVEDLTDETDPDHPKTIPGVLNGYMFIMKLHHTAESKAQSRGIGRYTMDMQPAKGGDEGAKRMGMLELSALLSSGGVRNVADIKYVKGQENLDYWRQFMNGYNPPSPRVPFVYDKFVNYLKGSGINVVRKGPRLNIMALTNQDVNALVGDRELKGVRDPRTGLNTLPTVSWDNNLKTLPGGLFDDDKTGGHAGNKWSYIQLDQKFPNPVMELPLRLMLGLTEDDFRKVMKGEKEIDTGTGPQALYEAAAKINIKNEIERARDDIASGKKTFRDAAIRKLGYLKSALALNQSPADWFMDKAPVLPPLFRPVSQMGGNKLPLVSDPNYLYKQLFDNNQAYMAGRKAFGDKNSGDLALDVYDAFKAVTGLGDPTTKELQQKKVSGLLSTVFGSGPKYNMIQRQLLGTPADMTGRAVISQEPNYDMDTVGIPEDLAWDAYKPFVIRALRRHGRSGLQAINEVKNKSKAAREMLQQEMESRPILINRAPTLHKFGFIAQWPKLIKGHTMKVNPFVCGGLGADFDGDSLITQLSIHTNRLDLVFKGLNDSCYDVKEENPNNFIDFLVPPLTNPSFSSIISSDVSEEVAHKTTDVMEETTMPTTSNTIVSGIPMSIADIPVVEGSKVVTAPGRTTWDVPEGFYIHSVNPVTMEVELSPITKKHLHENIEMYDVTVGTQTKRVLTVCEHDTLLTYKEGGLVITKAKDALGTCVLRSAQDKATVDSDTFVVRYIHIGNTIQLTKEIGMLIGAIVGDGWVDKYHHAYLSSDYEEIWNTYIDIANNSGIPQPGSKAQVHTYTAEGRWGNPDSSKVYFNFTAQAARDLHDKIGDGAVNKKLPIEIMKATKAVQIGALIGLFDTDGTVSFAAPSKGKKSPAKVIQYNTISPILRDQIISIASRLGIRASSTTYKSSSKGTTAYVITFSIPDFIEFCKHNPSFKLNHPERQANLEKIIESYDKMSATAKTVDVVPFPRHLNAIFAGQNIRADLLASWRKRGFLARVDALELVKVFEFQNFVDFVPSNKLPPAYRNVPEDFNWDIAVKEWCELVSNNQIQWDPITKVEKSEITYGWDITVPGNYTFLTSDGYAVQDCMQFHVPTTPDAVNEAIKKLMPSKNLLSPGDFSIVPGISRENLGGLYESTRAREGGSTRTFATKQDVIKAYKAGILGPTDKVKILRD